MANNGATIKWLNVMKISFNSRDYMCLSMRMYLHSIVKSFETIATSLVVQSNFTSLIVAQNQTTFVAEKVSCQVNFFWATCICTCIDMINKPITVLI